MPKLLTENTQLEKKYRLHEDSDNSAEVDRFGPLSLPDVELGFDAVDVAVVTFENLVTNSRSVFVCLIFP